MVPAFFFERSAIAVSLGVGLVVAAVVGCSEAAETPFFDRNGVAQGGGGGTTLLGGAAGTGTGGTSAGTTALGGDTGVGGDTGGDVTTGGTTAGSSGDAGSGMSGSAGSGVTGGTGSGGTSGASTGGVSGTDAGGTGGVVVDCSSIDATAVAYEDHCYVLRTTARIWTAARDDCSSHGGHLVTMGSGDRTEAQVIAENAFVWELGGMMEQWIGATDGRMSNQSGNGMPYAWITGEPITYDLWSAGQPNNSQSACEDPPAPCTCGDMCWEHCAFQWDPDNDEPGTWNDRHCEHLLPYVCEWDMVPN